MFKQTLRAAPPRILSRRTILQNRRFLSTSPPSQKSRSWKSSAARWALAAGGVYYYNTSNLFAEEPEAAIQSLEESIHHIQESKQPTIDAIVEQKRRREAQALADEERQRRNAEKAITQADTEQEDHDEEGLSGLEEEAGQQGAFNPETGEINWDCPCLGGMAHGPCGEEFRAAFSCFVYSTEEPKGVECIDKFKGMQDCFRAHPEMYGSELEDDEEEVEQELQAREQAKIAGEEAEKDTSASAPAAQKKSQESSRVGTGEEVEQLLPAREHVKGAEREVEAEEDKSDLAPAAQETSQKPFEVESQEVKKEQTKTYREGEESKPFEVRKAGDEAGDLVPQAAHDASSA